MGTLTQRAVGGVGIGVGVGVASAASGHAGLSRFSAFKHTDSHLVRQTAHGAVVTVVGFVIALLLLLHETKAYFMAPSQATMMVDTSLRRTLDIHLDVTFPAVPCAALALDVADIAGGTGSDAKRVAAAVAGRDGAKVGPPSADAAAEKKKQPRESNGSRLKRRQKEREAALNDFNPSRRVVVRVHKQRVDSSGRRIGGAEYVNPQIERLAPAGGGGSGASGGSGNNAAAPIPSGRASDNNNNPSSTTNNQVVTVDLGAAVAAAQEEEREVAASEGCRAYGTVTVPRVAGRLRFHTRAAGLGGGLDGKSNPIEMLPLLLMTGGAIAPHHHPLLNMSHSWHGLAFGPRFPGQSNPLDGLEMRVEAPLPKKTGRSFTSSHSGAF